MKRLALLVLSVYKRAVSPYLPGMCRYYPSCSEYSREAIERHGFRGGFLLTVRRLVRCHPGQEGGYDPVP